MSKAKKPKENVKRVRVEWELDLLRKAIKGAAMLAECLAADQLDSEVQERQAPYVIGAVLTLVDLRLAMTLAVLKGDADVESIFCAANDAGDESSEQEGVVLVAGK